MNNSKGIKLLAAVAVLAVMFAGAAIVFSDNGDVDAADSDTTYISGTITAGTGYDKINDQVYEGKSKVIIDKDLTIPKYAKLTINGASLTVNEGVTVTIEAGGELEIKAYTDPSTNTKTDPLVKINGKIVAEGMEKNGKNVIPAITNSAAAAADGKGVFVSGSIVLNKGAVMSGFAGNIVVLSGGSIEINKKNSNVSKIEYQTIHMAEGVSFTMNGYADGVTLTAYTGSDKYYQTSYVFINENSGRNASDSKNVSSIVVKTVVEKKQAVYGSFTNGNFTAADGTSKVTMKNYIMDVSGTLRGEDSIATDAGKNNGSRDNYYYGVDSAGKAVESELIAPTVSVSGELVVDETGKVTVAENTLMTVGGKIAVAQETKHTGVSAEYDNRLTIGGDLLVTGEVSFNWAALAKPDADKKTGKVTVDGGLMTIVDYSDANYGGTIANDDKIAGLYAAYYTVENVAAGTSTTYFCDLKDAVAGAVAAGSDEVVVYAGKESQTKTTAAEALKAGAYVVEDGTVIPDGITLRTMNALYVPKDATLTFDVGSEHIESIWGAKFIFVQGKLIDNDEILTAGDILYEVSKYNEDTNVTVYTTLTIALSEAVSGEVITLVSDATIGSTVTIPSGVTVNVGEAGSTGVTLAIGTADKEGELVIDGILNVNGTVTVVAKGKITLNNIIVLGDYITLDGIPGFYATGSIGDFEDASFILAPAVAAANSATLENLKVKAKTSYSGDLVFTAGENAGENKTITVNAEAVFGNITIDGFSVVVGTNGILTAVIGADVTAGHAAVKLDKVTSALTVKVDSQDSGEAVTTTLVITNEDATVLAGNLTIAEGQVYLKNSLAVGGYTAASGKSVMTVSSGAELILTENKTLAVSAKDLGNEKDYYGLVIDGTLTTGKGTLLISNASGNATKPAKVLVNGTLAVNNNQGFAGIVTVLGTLAIDDEAAVTVAGSMIVGKAPETLGAAATVTGKLELDDAGKLSVYPGADMSGAEIVDADTGDSAYSLELLINGQLYMTGYTATGATKVSAFIPGTVKLTGYKNIANTNWFLDEKLTTAVGAEDTVADHSKAYAAAVLKTADVQVSIGKGMSVFIDNVRYSNGQIATDLTVGEHTIAVTVDPGYDGAASILFDGAAVNNGVFTISADMADKTIVLSVTGDITVNPGTVVTEDDGDGMGITDILLIVLVVLIAVMAIMVALRMMRS